MEAMNDTVNIPYKKQFVKMINSYVNPNKKNCVFIAHNVLVCDDSGEEFLSRIEYRYYTNGRIWEIWVYSDDYDLPAALIYKSFDHDITKHLNNAINEFPICTITPTTYMKTYPKGTPPEEW